MGFISWKRLVLMKMGIGFSTVISIIYWDTKANMTHIALFFDRTDRIAGVFCLQKTYLSRREIELVMAISTTYKDRLFHFREEGENSHGQSPRVERVERNKKAIQRSLIS